MKNITQSEYESKYLENEHPILIKPLIAAALNSDRQAYFIQQVKYWMNKNRDKGRNYHDGHQWMFNTLEDWRAEFPWLSLMTIRRIVDTLKTKEILITGNYNKKKYDKTTWYSINERKLDEVIERYKSECSKRTKASVQNEQMDDTKKNAPIPETSHRLKESVRQLASKPPARANLESKKGVVNELISCYMEDYKNRFGYNYPVSKGKDYAIIKKLLTDHGITVTEIQYTMVAAVEVFMGLTKIFVGKRQAKNIDSQADALNMTKGGVWGMYRRMFPALLAVGAVEQPLGKWLHGHMIIAKGVKK